MSVKRKWRNKNQLVVTFQYKCIERTELTDQRLVTTQYKTSLTTHEIPPKLQTGMNCTAHSQLV